MSRDPRRAYNPGGSEIEMTLGNMRSQEVQSVVATCQAVGSGHEAVINRGWLPGTLLVLDIALKLRCSECGGRSIKRMPTWKESA